MCQPHQAPVTIDTRALIDGVLARYSGEFTVFRELLQNSDDAGCDSVEIHFETVAFSGQDPPTLADSKTINVVQWTFKNHGKPFTQQDWDRLPKIALGNPDPQKVGAFGVGFYSLFSVTESPYVSSGDKEMKFEWNDKNQLYYRFGDLPQTATEDLWTTFKMPLREPTPMPPVADFMQFLASSITFMAHLKDVAVFFDHYRVGQINKSQRQFRAIPIPTELLRSSPEKNMVVRSVCQYPITIEATSGIKPPQYGSVRTHEPKVNLTVFTAEVEVTVDEKLFKELKRCTKKDPPSLLKYSLIYTGKGEYDQSRIDEQKHPCEFPSVFRGLRADLDGALHTRIFIGHATAQTTGIGGHMASYFIPTVERESIDLVDRNIATWNRELLYVGGFLCRTVYELELSRIQTLWEEGATGDPQSRPSRELQDRLHHRFLHVLKFFTFHHSTPSSKVAQFLADSFYGCSTLPLRLLSSVGVRKAPDIRMFDPVLAKFVKTLPMLSEYVMQHGKHSIAALPERHKISTIVPSEVLQDLRHHILDVEELVACLKWQRTCGQDGLGADLLGAATLRGTSGVICLSSITHFIDQKVLGVHIPPNGPLPLSLIPLGISKHFGCEELTSFGWKEFTVALWLQHISSPNVMADERYDFTRSVDWAGRVLSVLRRVWPQLSEHVRSESREVFKNKQCIPTSKGLSYPESSYLPIVDNALLHRLDLPLVSCDSGFEVDEDMKRFLLFIGVRENLPVELLHQMLSTGGWTASDLVGYLIQEMPSSTSQNISHLKSSRIFFMRDTPQSNKAEITRYRADELYPPKDIFGKLQLPVIEWSGKSVWKDTSPEAQMLYRLGLNRFPPLPKIMELCSSRDVGVQQTAFVHLYSKLDSQYPDYKPENFADVEFIPAESKGGTCLKKLGEVCSGAQWKALGFYVVQDQYQSAALHQLGVAQHPPMSKILDLLEKTPPPDEETAGHWFKVLYDHKANFSPSDLIKLSGLPIVPTGPSSAPKLLPPTKCHLGQGTRSVLYAKLFVFVDLGPDANNFLVACGSKNNVSIEDVAEVLIENPKQFFDLAGGHEGFLVELRKLAHQSHNIPNATLDKMSREPTLLGVRRRKPDGQAGWVYKYELLTSQGVTIVDDIDDYQLFSERLFVAPQEEALERFYASLGCNYLSAVVNESCNDLHEMPATKTFTEVRSLILERLPLFTQKYTDTKLKVTIPSGPDRLKVKACRSIVVSKTLVTEGVKQTRDVWATARREGDCIELWISETAERDMYEVAACLCRELFGTNKMHDTLLLEMILRADLAALERRGFPVDQVSRPPRDGGSASATNSLQQFALGTRAGPRLRHEKLPGSCEATAQLPSLPHATDNILSKVHGASDVSSENPLYTIGHSTSARVSCEVIAQSYIRDNVEKAVEACRLGGKESAVHVGMSQFLSSGFCSVSADPGKLRPVGQVKNIEVCIGEGMPDPATLMERMRGPLARFVDIIISLSEIYRLPTTTLRIFYDISGGCIAFNCRGTIYLNLRYFEVWHDEQVKSGNRQNARMSWFLALAHEIAHNLTDLHDSDHEFWFSAICEAHLIAFSQLLRPGNTWPRYVLWLRLVPVIVLFAYLANRIAPVANIP
ncbi:hypothetical protein HD554DRAFT_2149343 [Boletus coccyginus]|nr:hypothetical protein HD554DRAFT_2149343 [Boletus coccyginus]